MGGGRDILSALVLGKRKVTGIEVNPIFVELLTERSPFAEFGGLSERPDVTLVADEARSWLARTTERFDFVQMSVVDSWAATGAGAFTLSENALYTEEAWRIVLARLTPRGVFTISRWYHPDHLYETGRLLSLAVASLVDAGATSPRRHLFLAANNSPNRASSIATLVVARAPLEADEIAALEQMTSRFGHTVLLSPRTDPPSELLQQIASAATRGELDRVTGGASLELRPPTDDRPFFFNYLRLDRPREILARVGLLAQHEPDSILGGVIVGNVTALLTLAVIVGVSLLLVVLVIVLPSRVALRDADGRVVWQGTAYFSLLGLGYMLVEMALLQRTSVLLGHPVYALGLVLFGMITATGLGSLLSARLPLASRTALAVWPLATAGYVAVVALAAPVVYARFEDDATPVRALVALLVIVPAGLCMGYGMPTGLRAVGRLDARLTPWLWGVNGAAGVLAGGLAVAISLTFGIAATLLVGAACYALLAPPLLALARR